MKPIIKEGKTEVVSGSRIYPSKAKGVTMVELLISIAMAGLFAGAMVLAYKTITKGVDSTKDRSIANNLLQEKIEKLKDVNYYRLIATPAAALANPDDASNPYPPETVTISNVTFTRATVITKLQDVAGVLTFISPTDPDEGIKKIEITVGWTFDGATKAVTLANLVQNPDRTPLTGVIRGTVKDTGGTPVTGAYVYVVDDPSRTCTTAVTGYYSISVVPGTYTLRVDKKGYVSQTSGSVTATAGSTSTSNFTNLALRPKGSSSGNVFNRDHLVFSEVCAQISAGDLDEYVEIYNSSSTPVTINSGNFQLKYVDSSNVVTSLPLNWTRYVVPANGFFLIGRTATVNSVSTDANWIAGSVLTDEKCGVIIADGSGTTIDKVGWGKPGSGMPAPSNAVEATGVDLSSTGLDPGRVIERKPYPGTSAPSVNGNAYDSNDNSIDFSNHNTLSTQNSLSAAETPTGGTPVTGAYVFCDDDLSSPTISTSTATFTLTNIAVGVWNLSGACSSIYGTQTNVTILTSVNTAKDIILNTVSTSGYIAGRVTNTTGTALASISMYCGGATAQTDTNGNYRLVVNEGSHYATANYGNANTNYTTDTYPSILTVVAGIAFSNIDFVLNSGGAVTGKVTTNGTDALPNVYIVAKDFGNNERGSAVSSSTGVYTIQNLAVLGNPHTLFPAIDDKEVSSPTCVTSTVVAGTTLTHTIANPTNFTITTALGTITGTVKVSTNIAITTGVLIVATTGATITGDPPTVNSSLRSGSTVYYSTTSDSNGSYSLPVRGSAAGTVYNVYGWYTTSAGVTTKRPSSGVSTTTITGNGSGTVNFDF